MVSEKELEKGLIYRGKNPHCTYCGKRLRLFEIKVKTGTDWEVRCGKCGRKPYVNEKFINWDNMKAKYWFIGWIVLGVVLAFMFN